MSFVHGLCLAEPVSSRTTLYWCLAVFPLESGEAGGSFLSSRFQLGVPQRVLHTSVCKDVGQPPITHLGLGNFWGKEEQDRLKVLIEERYRK